MLSSVLKLALILLAAAVLAVGARAAYIARQAPALKTAEAPTDIRVRVAAADLPAGLLLRDTDLSWKAYPRSGVPIDALQEGSPEAELSGVLVRHALQAGRLISANNIIRPDAPGFLAAALKPGMRAVSVPIDEVSGHAGLILPGDYVDMILTQTLKHDDDDGRKNAVVSETMVENVRVIAVGTSFQPQHETALTKTRARTVTLEVDPRAAEAVTVAAQLGTLSMALRSFAIDDRDPAARVEVGTVVAWEGNRPDAQPVWGGDVSRALKRPAPEAVHDDTGRPHNVLIFRGSDRQEHNFGAQQR
ncbi:Flp pilus assembly protein CpaB [Pusillimonas sp.]|uniref:Flp pilus assembly protein CpaB n=1 Tax=Pusillimonas sp. TaxID=3040095 RepID=UPI0037CB241F